MKLRARRCCLLFIIHRSSFPKHCLGHAADQPLSELDAIGGGGIAPQPLVHCDFLFHENRRNLGCVISASGFTSIAISLFAPVTVRAGWLSFQGL